MRIGVRELWNNLSRCLGHLRAGHTVTVIVQGLPVASIVPVSMPSALERLIDEGRATPAKQLKRPAGRRVRSAGIVNDLVSDQRR